MDEQLKKERHEEYYAQLNPVVDGIIYSNCSPDMSPHERMTTLVPLCLALINLTAEVYALGRCLEEDDVHQLMDASLNAMHDYVDRKEHHA